MNYFVPGVDRTEFHTILVVGRSAVRELESTRQTVLLLPTMSRDLYILSLSGLQTTTMRPYVTSFLLSVGTFAF